MTTIEWCGCSHSKEDHATGQCAGEIIFNLADGQGDITGPCPCKGYKFWFAEELYPKCNPLIKPHGKNWAKCASDRCARCEQW